jgi:FkbM family methyltransferase
MSIKYHIGQMALKNGYKICRDYKYPEIHGNLLQLGLSLLKTKSLGPIQLVQIGAFDGLLADPLENILKDNRVSAVLVEPQTTPFNALVNRYGSNSRIKLVNGVVAATDGSATLYVPDEDASPKASLSKTHYRRFGLSPSTVRDIQVPAYSVASLLRQNSINKVDVLQLDTEGMDFEILRWFLAAKQEPALINFETLHLSKQDKLAAREILKKDYWYIETDQDTFAISTALIS